MSEALTALWEILQFCWLAVASVVLAAILYSAVATNYEKQRQKPSAWRRWRYCPKGDHRDSLFILWGVLGDNAGELGVAVIDLGGEVGMAGGHAFERDGGRDEGVCDVSGRARGGHAFGTGFAGLAPIFGPDTLWADVSTALICVSTAVRAFIALVRAVRSTRRASTLPSRAFGVEVPRWARTDSAAW